MPLDVNPHQQQHEQWPEYMDEHHQREEPPAQRRWVNQQLTRQLNQQLGFQLTDAFCGFKAYRVEALKKLDLTETGYAMPLELWVQAAAAGLKIMELPVPLIYLDEKRSFGGDLDDAATRLNYYYEVFDRSLAAARRRGLSPGWRRLQGAYGRRSFQTGRNGRRGDEPCRHGCPGF